MNKAGSFSTSVWNNGKYFIKVFDPRNFIPNKIFPDFIDYKVYELCDSNQFGILPKLYGYSGRHFMVTEYIEGISFTKDLTGVTLNNEQLEKLINSLVDTLVNMFKLSGIVVDDIHGKNIVFNSSTNQFHFIDLSCVSAFSALYFAKQNIEYKIKNLMEVFVYRGFITKETHDYSRICLKDSMKRNFT